jgi:uncharacterized protein related to proFAR isomerase
MEVILAVDIKKGRVVKAFAGLRINYKPLFLNNEDYSDPIKLIRSINNKITLKKVYIADLDSISKLKPNEKLIEKILEEFPEINFLIDAGFDYPISVYNFHRRLGKVNISNYKIVLGTESLKNFKLQNFNKIKKFELSVDFNGKQEEWVRKINKEKLRLEIILMFLKKVGGRGLDLALIRRFLKLFPQHKCSVAGGVNNRNQISTLSRIGVKAVLCSTLLHQKISRD